MWNSATTTSSVFGTRPRKYKWWWHAPTLLNLCINIWWSKWRLPFEWGFSHRTLDLAIWVDRYWLYLPLDVLMSRLDVDGEKPCLQKHIILHQCSIFVKKPLTLMFCYILPSSLSIAPLVICSSPYFLGMVTGRSISVSFTSRLGTSPS